MEATAAQRRPQWCLGWWAPIASLAPAADIVDPGVHGPLLAALAEGAPLDGVGRERLGSLRAAGLLGPDDSPRFPVCAEDRSDRARVIAETLGSAAGRVLAGEWSRLQVEYESLQHSLAEADAALFVVGSLVLDVGVRRLLRQAGIAAPLFGSELLWLVEGGHGAAGQWRTRTRRLNAGDYLVYVAGEGASTALDRAPGPLSAAQETTLRDLVEAMTRPLLHLIEGAVDQVGDAARTIPGGDPSAVMAWVWSLALDVALASLASRGLLAVPKQGWIGARVADPVLAGL